MKIIKGLYNKIKEEGIKINRETKLKDNSKEVMELKFMLQNNMWM
ncbi:hypothetical protein [Clostridium tetani]|nr:hypothetical protein [Clostridium tetani]